MEADNSESDLSFYTTRVIEFYLLIPASSLVTLVFVHLFETKELWLITVLSKNSFWQLYLKLVNLVWSFLALLLFGLISSSII